MLKVGARKIDKPALITSKIRERFFGKTRERTKNKGKKQAPSAVRLAAICFNKNILRNFLNYDKIFLVLEMYLRHLGVILVVSVAPNFLTKNATKNSCIDVRESL